MMKSGYECRKAYNGACVRFCVHSMPHTKKECTGVCRTTGKKPDCIEVNYPSQMKVKFDEVLPIAVDRGQHIAVIGRLSKADMRAIIPYKNFVLIIDYTTITRHDSIKFLTLVEQQQPLLIIEHAEKMPKCFQNHIPLFWNGIKG